MLRAFYQGLALLGALLFSLAAANAAPLGTIRIGVLKYGTVNWSLDVIKRHGLDAKEGFTLDVQPFGGTDAADVALMGKAVDAVVEDWLWVSRQRTSGAMLSFVPYSSNIGAVMVASDSPIHDLAALKGRTIGVAGGPLDKSWLLVQAFAKKHGGIDLAADARPVFGAPPLLAQKLRSGELDALIDYWNYCAQLEAEGARRLLDVAQAQAAFGVPASVPQLGYVFHDAWGQSHAELVQAFVRATRASDAILAHDDAEWQRLKPLTRADSDAVARAYMQHYREGIVEHWGQKQRDAAALLYKVLAQLGGTRLVGEGQELAPGTFWPDVSY